MRLRPATRALPKEMLPVGGKPVIQHIVEELIANGIDRVVFVTAPGKDAIDAHFSGQYAGVSFVSVVQSAPRGLGDALLQADGFTGDDAFALALGDAILGTREPSMAVARLAAVLEAEDADCVIAVREVPRPLTGRYGIVVTEPARPGSAARVRAIVEKPAPADAPSTLAVSARYVMTKAIFAALRRTPIGRFGELELTDAIATLIDGGGRVMAVDLGSVPRHDIGTHEGYARAFLAFALTDPEYGEALRRHARGLLDGHG
jgi:UTP--glucose-1-phosphate uridylyltransferase